MRELIIRVRVAGEEYDLQFNEDKAKEIRDTVQWFLDSGVDAMILVLEGVKPPESWEIT